ncbi:MAG: HEAT repeat domain-containing protein [Phycisphaerae bacterium]
MSLTCCIACVCVRAQNVTTRPLTAAEDMELKTLSGQLADPARDAKTKLDAAALLLTRTYAQAADALKEALLDNANRAAQIAVAEAIARNGTDIKAFVDPLAAMLTGQEPTVRDAAARALAAYKDPKVTEKLLAIAADKARDRAIRLVAVASLQRILDKAVVDALVTLLDDSDAEVRTAAMRTLENLTNIRAFGTNRYQWKEWWLANKDKDRSRWLADLAEGLGQAKTALEAENARLRTRLAKAMIDLYAATPANQRDAMVIGLLKDSLEDVRLVGLELLARSLDAGSQASPEMRTQVRSMLADTDTHVRQESARLIAGLGDPEALKALMERLKIETAPAVRQGIMVALGQLRDPKALQVVLVEVNTSKSEEVAAAAATALGKIASKGPLDDQTRKSCACALVDRFKAQGGSAPDAPLREALLAAMGDVNDKTFIPVLDGALKDEAATVRLAAVNSLAALGAAASAPSIEKLLADTDRGVRGAAIAALRTLGGQKYLQAIMNRTDPAVEDDAGNRSQAWSHAMAILAKCDAKVLADAADKLAGRTDATAERIKIMQMLVASLKEAKSPELAPAMRQLGAVLVKNARAAEAAACLGEAHVLFLAAKDSQAPAVWLEWVEALLAADDGAAVKAIADQTAEAQFTKAIASLDARLAELKKKASWQGIVVLAGEAVKLLSANGGTTQPARLSDEQLKAYADMRTEAQSQQAAADRQRVGKLVAQLSTDDAAAAKAAVTELAGMGDRAVKPLLLELKALLEVEKPDAKTVAAEQAVVEVLRQIAPKMTGYDPASPKDKRLKIVAVWLAQ